MWTILPFYLGGLVRALNRENSESREEPGGGLTPGHSRLRLSFSRSTLYTVRKLLLICLCDIKRFSSEIITWLVSLIHTFTRCETDRIPSANGRCTSCRCRHLKLIISFLGRYPHLSVIFYLQAVIKLRSEGEYCVINEGRRPLYIDGKPVVLGTKARLHHNSTFEVKQATLHRLSLFCFHHTKIIQTTWERLLATLFLNIKWFSIDCRPKKK